jgi:hypothetical protein
MWMDAAQARAVRAAQLGRAALRIQPHVWRLCRCDRVLAATRH